MNEFMMRKAAKHNVARDIGFSKKMENVPSDRTRDWRHEFSQIGPRIKATISGAG